MEGKPRFYARYYGRLIQKAGFSLLHDRLVLHNLNGHGIVIKR